MQAVQSVHQTETACNGVCHAVCAWAEFDFGGGAVINAGPRALSKDGSSIEAGPSSLCGTPWNEPVPWAQGVCLLEKPVSVSARQPVEVSLRMDLCTGALVVSVDGAS
eukprot:3479856-Prymnesium_polylepis.1